MEIVQRAMTLPKRRHAFTIVPIGDIHLGTRACDEDLLKAVVDRVAGDPDCYWVGMGDYCEFINMKDKRFDAKILAPWIGVGDLVDIAQATMNRLLPILKPIAKKCLGLIKGNHEGIIERHSEYNVFSNILNYIKEKGELKNEHLNLGFMGYLLLSCKHSTSSTTVKIIAMHGAKASELAGAKALNMQRWLWTHDCDVTMIAHNHDDNARREVVHVVNGNGTITETVRRGVYTGSFYRTNVVGASTYGELKQMLPLPLGGCELRITPFADNPGNKVRVIT